ncbi:AIPR family protein [Leptolyngbya sp. BC1307]|uniref:AIPR family protein n=1 Tax=Leptolyngbya sp. BC1307 TaxID=2029589 RepID=UPI000EFB14DA|nr:AIPR family protein [Leptolyngbya sp. BC1307]
MNNGRLSTFQIKQIDSELVNLFEDKIDMSDYGKKKLNEKQLAFKSRALAAYSLHILAGVSSHQAAESIVDGFDDNGIDALLFQKSQSTLWLVQSKWIQTGKKSPQAAELRSFKDGIFDLLDFNSSRDRFNYKFECKEDEINAALTCPGLKIRAVVAYTGSALGKHSRGVLSDLTEDLNDGEDIASCDIFDLESTFKALSDRHNKQDINVQFELSNWGRVDEPYKAFYGQINASDVGRWWVEHKNKIFDQNIREFIGESSVNQEISGTMNAEPELFWYFNNGITVLCKEINKVGAKKTRNIGDFDAKGISIVNGAQTIGCIGALYQSSSPEEREKIEYAEISIRFISLEGCEEDFGSRVTKATNTQNRVESRDFIALDSEQARLSKEFRTCGNKYHYKRTAETIVRDEKNYELEEATVALACMSQDVALVIQAKQELSSLWTDSTQPPYTSLFNSYVDATRLCRCIDIKRRVEELVCKEQKDTDNKTRKAVLNHGNLFVLHLVFARTKQDVFSSDTSELDFSNFVNSNVPDMARKIIDKIEKDVSERYKASYVWNMFRSVQKSRKLKDRIL